MTEQGGSRDRLDSAIERLQTVDGDWDRARLATYESAAATVASIAGDEGPLAAEYTTEICSAFELALEGDRGTDAQGTDHRRGEQIEAVIRSLATAIKHLVTTDRASRDRLVTAIVDGLASTDGEVVETMATAAEPIVDTGDTIDERLVAALAEALRDTDDSDAGRALAERLRAVLKTDAAALVPHTETIANAIADSFMLSQTAELVALLATAEPDALADQTDRIASQIGALVDNRSVTEPKMVTMFAPLAVALYAVGEADRTAVSGQVESIAWFAALDPDSERSRVGAETLAGIVEEEGAVVADPSVAEAAVAFTENAVTDDQQAEVNSEDIGSTFEGWQISGDGPDETDTDPTTAGVEASLRTLRVIVESEPELVAPHFESLLTSVEAADPAVDPLAAEVTRATAAADPETVADAATTAANLFGRSESTAVAADWLEALLSIADVTTLPPSTGSGIAAGMHRHDTTAVGRGGLAVLTAADLGPAGAARHLDAVLTGLYAIADGQTAEADALAAAAIGTLSDACRADPEAVVDRRDEVVTAVAEHQATPLEPRVAILATVADADPSAVVDEIPVIVTALTDGDSDARPQALAAVRRVAAAHPEVVADYASPVLSALPQLCETAESETSQAVTQQATDALSTLLHVASKARTDGDDATRLGRRLAAVPDTAAILEGALSAAEPRTTRAQQFALDVFGGLLDALPEDIEGEHLRQTALVDYQRTFETVRDWAGWVDDRSTDAVCSTDATLLRLAAKDRLEAVIERRGSVPDGTTEGLTDRFEDDLSASDGDVMINDVSGVFGDEPTMDPPTAAEVVSTTAPDGDESARQRRTAAAKSLAIAAAGDSEIGADYADVAGELLLDCDYGGPDAQRRTLVATIIFQAVGQTDPGTVVEYVEPLLTLLEVDRDETVQVAALAPLAHAGAARPDLLSDAVEPAQRAAAAASEGVAQTYFAVLAAFVALSNSDRATADEHIGTLTTAGAGDDAETVEVALYHLQRIANRYPEALTNHLDGIAATVEGRTGTNANRACTALAFAALGADSHDWTGRTGTAVADALQRLPSQSTGAEAATLTLKTLVGDAENPLDGLDTDAEGLASATMSVLTETANADVAEAAAVLLAAVTAERPEALLVQLQAVVETVEETRRQFPGEQVTYQAVLMLVQLIGQEPAEAGTHFGTVLRWLADFDFDDRTARASIERALRLTATIVRDHPALLRPHARQIVGLADETGIVRDVALTVCFLAVRGDLEAAGDALETVVPALDRAGHRGLQNGASTVLAAAAFNSEVPPAVARRTGEALARDDDPASLVGSLLDILSDEPDMITTFVRMLEGLASATSDATVRVRCNVELFRVLVQYDAGDAATAGAACDCLGIAGGRNVDVDTEFALLGDD